MIKIFGLAITSVTNAWCFSMRLRHSLGLNAFGLLSRANSFSAGCNACTTRANSMSPMIIKSTSLPAVSLPPDTHPKTKAAWICQWRQRLGQHIHQTRGFLCAARQLSVQSVRDQASQQAQRYECGGVRGRG
jgi:hypothetical protein